MAGDSNDQQRHAPAFEGMDEVEEAMRLASELCLIEDPPEEPFRSKYKARDALKKARRSLTETGSEGGAKDDQSSIALIDYRLGVIALAVEENSAAQESLDLCADAFFDGVVGKVMEAAGDEEDDEGDDGNPTEKEELPVMRETPHGMVDPSPLARDHPVEAADTLTQLGILWASRGYVRRSLLYLLASVSFLREISSLASLSDTIRHDGNPSTSSSSSSRNDTIGDECIVSDGSSATAETKATSSGAGNGDSEPDDVRHNKERKQEKHRNLRAKLESLLTHAYYFLAQAYGARDVKMSAKYCALTLQRQLDAYHRGLGTKVSFDRGDWSRNACFLADYYASLNQYPAAGRCLLAAQAVLDRKTGENPPCSSVRRSSPDEPTAASGTSLRPKSKKTSDDEGEDKGDCRQRREQAAPVEAQAEAKRADAGSPDTALPSPPASSKPPEAGPTTGSSDHATGFVDDEANSPAVNGQDGGDGPIWTGTNAGNEADGRGEGDDEEMTEQRREQRADVHRHMAKLYLTVMQTKHEERSLVAAGIDPDAESGGSRPTGGKETGEEARGLSFASLALGDLPNCDPSLVPRDFESVRDVFKRAKSHTDRALEHYVLDGFVTAHVALHQGMSRAYLYLSTFEDDNKRKYAMCSRRAQALEPLLRVLGAKAYERLHKELSFELGEIYQDLADIKVLRVQEKVRAGARSMTAADISATNKLLQSAVGFLSHFVAMYHEGDTTRGAADSRSRPAKGMEAVEAAGYLKARFMRARLNGKLQLASREQTLQALRLSCAEFSWLVEHARGHLSGVRERDPGIFEQELELAEEMAQLQRRNIANLERQVK